MNEELQDFLSELPQEDKRDDDIFKQELTAPASEKEEEKETPEKEEGRKNRRHRRLEAQLAEEREARIRAEARAEAQSEVRKFTQETDVDPRLLRMYGNTDEGKEAALLHQELLTEQGSKAKEEALKEFREEQNKVAEDQKKFESFIDSELESLEDEHNVDLTSNAPSARKARAKLLAMVEKLSPKDASGEVSGYADFGGAWEVLQSQAEKPDNSRQRDLADRSMAKSGPVDTSKAIEDEGLSWLRRNGIRV